jgi:hypothetical protein
VILQQILHRLQSQSLRDLGTEADVEVGFTDPNPVQDAGKLARHRSVIAHNMLDRLAIRRPHAAMPAIS